MICRGHESILSAPETLPVSGGDRPARVLARRWGFGVGRGRHGLTYGLPLPRE